MITESFQHRTMIDYSSQQIIVKFISSKGKIHLWTDGRAPNCGKAKISLLHTIEGRAFNCSKAYWYRCAQLKWALNCDKTNGSMYSKFSKNIWNNSNKYARKKICCTSAITGLGWSGPMWFPFRKWCNTLEIYWILLWYYNKEKSFNFSRARVIYISQGCQVCQSITYCLGI